MLPKYSELGLTRRKHAESLYSCVVFTNFVKMQNFSYFFVIFGEIFWGTQCLHAIIFIMEQLCKIYFLPMICIETVGRSVSVEWKYKVLTS